MAKKEKKPVLVPTDSGRYYIENMTRYNTDDLLAILNIVEREARARAVAHADQWFSDPADSAHREQHINNWWSCPRRVPFGAKIQFVDRMNGTTPVSNRIYDQEAKDWKVVVSRRYLDMGDWWNIVRFCPPDKLHSNPLEALSSGDMTTMPDEMARQFLNYATESMYQIGPMSDRIKPVIRIEAERGSPKRGANRRPAQLGTMFDDVCKLSYRIGEGLNGVVAAKYGLNRVMTREQELNIQGLDRLKEELEAANEAVNKAKKTIDDYINNFPAE